MPSYDLQCSKCKCIFEDIISVSDLDKRSVCPDCGAHAKRLISMPAMVRGDTVSWSNENKGKGRRISQLDHGVRQPYYAKSQSEAISEAKRRGLQVCKA